MTDAGSDEGDDSTDGFVIISLTVNSERPIAALAGLPGRKRPPREDDDFLYEAYSTSFNAPYWEDRADQVDAAITAAVDALEATGVDPAVLADDSVFVKAFFTFPPGAETIRAEAVARLAAIHATIWLDLYGE